MEFFIKNLVSIFSVTQYHFDYFKIALNLYCYTGSLPLE